MHVSQLSFNMSFSHVPSSPDPPLPEPDEYLTQYDIDNTIPELNARLNYSALKKVAKLRTVPDLLESDLEESFVRGAPAPSQPHVLRALMCE
jgi:hypothetical protein